MTLHALILAWVFYLAPTTTPARAEEIYDAVAAATADTDEAAQLVTTWHHESHFRPEVESCRVTGDNGRSLGAFQLQRHFRGGFSVGDFCQTVPLQAQLALRALRITRGSGDVRRAFARYTGRRRTDGEVSRRVVTYEALRALHGVA